MWNKIWPNKNEEFELDFDFNSEASNKKKQKVDWKNTMLWRLPWAEFAQNRSTSHQKRTGIKTALTFALSWLTFGATNAIQDDIIKYLTTTSQTLKIDGLTGEQIAQKTQSNFDAIKKTNNDIAKASDSINLAINIFNQNLLPQVKNSTQNSAILVENAKTSITHFQNQIDQTNKKLSQIDKMLAALEKKQKDAPISQQEIDSMQEDFKNWDIGAAASQAWKSISDWFTWNAINVTVWDTISKLHEMRNWLLETQKKYKESKIYFEKILKDFESMGKNFENISNQISTQVNSIDTKNLTISNSTDALWKAANEWEKFYSQSQLSDIIAKEKIDNLIDKLENYFLIMNAFSIILAIYSGILLVWHHRNNLIDQKKALFALSIWLAGFLTPSVLENKAVSTQIKNAETGQYWPIPQTIVQQSNNLSDIFEKTLIKVFGWENIVK